VLISFIAVCSLAIVQGNVFKGFADDAIYEAIRVVLRRQYPDNDQKVACMVDDFRRNKVADKFYTFDLLTNQDKLSQEVIKIISSKKIVTLNFCFPTDTAICR
jgi:hypothetical protein